MLQQPLIQSVNGQEILDSRGNPTILATVTLRDGTVAQAASPSGASTGIYEAHERRDGEAFRYDGRGVRFAVADIQTMISPALSGRRVDDQRAVDQLLCQLDGTPNKDSLGANTILAVSLACARAAAAYYHLPLYRYLGGTCANRLPVPMMNVLNGGAHASNNVEIQEFMIVPVGAETFAEGLRIGSEIYHSLGKYLKTKGYSCTVGDEGGYAPNLASDEEALDLLCHAITNAGYTTDTVRLALDAAASEWATSDGNETSNPDLPPDIYHRRKRRETFTPEELIHYWERLSSRYPLLSLEDGLDQRDFAHWELLTRQIGEKLLLVGDDLFVTNPRRLQEGIRRHAGNSILIKPNQIGTLSETLDVIRQARQAGFRYIISHRSGETADTTIADLAVATGAPYIKSGAPCRSERLAKYNRLLQIEKELDGKSVYGV